MLWLRLTLCYNIWFNQYTFHLLSYYYNRLVSIYIGTRFIIATTIKMSYEQETRFFFLVKQSQFIMLHFEQLENEYVLSSQKKLLMFITERWSRLTIIFIAKEI